MPAIFAVCLAALATSCGDNVVQFPLDGDTPPAVETLAGAVLAGTVAAPNYAIDFEPFALLKNVDNVVHSASGYAQLVAGSNPGQDYAIYVGALSVSSTLAEVEAAYDGAQTTGAVAQLTTLQLPGEWFELVGELLDTTIERTVIIRNTEQSVSSYQLLVVRFY